MLGQQLTSSKDFIMISGAARRGADGGIGRGRIDSVPRASAASAGGRLTS